MSSAALAACAALALLATLSATTITSRTHERSRARRGTGRASRVSDIKATLTSPSDIPPGQDHRRVRVRHEARGTPVALAAGQLACRLVQEAGPAPGPGQLRHPQEPPQSGTAGQAPALSPAIHPTSSSWLNLVERWFAELTNRKLRR